jgi:hypothetical protein
MPFDRSLVQTGHQPTKGKEVQVFIARLAKGQAFETVVEQTLTVNANVAKGATSIALTTPLTGPIKKGQYLCFADANDVERLVLITADANPTVATPISTLTVKELDEAITANAKAEFPPYLWDRTGADLDESFANNKVTTFNTGGAEDGTPTTKTAKVSLPGLKWHYNAAYRTALKAAHDQAFVYVKRMEPAPNSNFTTGDVYEGRGLVTSHKSAAGTDANVTGDLDVEFMGAPKITDPVSVA